MMARLLQRLRSDRRGVATIELALAAPILATLVVGVVDMSNAYGRKLALEQAAQVAIERIMQTTGTTTPDATLKQEAADAAGVPIGQVTTAYVLECNNVPKANFTDDCTSGQYEARYLRVTIASSYTPIFPNKLFGNRPDGKYHFSATAGVRTQ